MNHVVPKRGFFVGKKSSELEKKVKLYYEFQVVIGQNNEENYTALDVAGTVRAKRWC